MALDPLFLQLLEVYQDAYKELLKRLSDQELRGLSTYHTDSLLNDILEIIDKLRSYNRDFVSYSVPTGYREGSNQTVNTLTGKYHFLQHELDLSFGGIHQEAVLAIVRDTYESIAAATDYMEEGLKQAIRDVAKEKYQLGIITGETRIKMTKGLVDDLSQKGFTTYLDQKGRYIPLKDYASAVLDENWVGFVDAAGRRWDLENYAEMLTRTKVLEASNQGTENRLRANGLDLVIITSHHAEDWCRFYENRVFSISGESPDYPPLEQVPNHGCPMHPRCRHSEAPFIEKFEGNEVVSFGKGIDKKYLGLNTEKGYADQAALRRMEREVKLQQL